MVNYSDQVVSFIGFKVAVMGPFGLVWVIITFMHDLRWQCRPRKTWLKFNHFLIYVFMQELTMDGHEGNNAVSLGLVWYPRSVQPRCRTWRFWRWSNISRFRQLVPDWLLAGSVLLCGLEICVCDYNSHQCIKDVFLKYTLTCFFCILVWPPRGAKFLKNAGTKNISWSTASGFANKRRMPIESRRSTPITVVNKCFFYSPSYIILFLLHRKKASRHSCFDGHGQISESRHLNTINWKAAAQLLW